VGISLLASRQVSDCTERACQAGVNVYRVSLDRSVRIARSAVSEHRIARTELASPGRHLTSDGERCAPRFCRPVLGLRRDLLLRSFRTSETFKVSPCRPEKTRPHESLPLSALLTSYPRVDLGCERIPRRTSNSLFTRRSAQD